MDLLSTRTIFGDAIDVQLSVCIYQYAFKSTKFENFLFQPNNSKNIITVVPRKIKCNEGMNSCVTDLFDFSFQNSHIPVINKATQVTRGHIFDNFNQ